MIRISGVSKNELDPCLVQRLSAVHPAVSKPITFPFLASTAPPLLLDMQPVKVGGVVVHQEVLFQMSAFAWGSKHSVGRLAGSFSWLISGLVSRFIIASYTRTFPLGKQCAD